MKDRQADFAKIIMKGSLSEIQDFMTLNFHKIKHAESFALILNRLKEQSDLLGECLDAISGAVAISLLWCPAFDGLYSKKYEEEAKALASMESKFQAILNKRKEAGQ